MGINFVEIKDKDVGELGYLTNVMDNLSQWDAKEHTLNGVKKVFVRVFAVGQPEELNSKGFLGKISLM